MKRSIFIGLVSIFIFMCFAWKALGGGQIETETVDGIIYAYNVVKIEEKSDNKPTQQELLKLNRTEVQAEIDRLEAQIVELKKAMLLTEEERCLEYAYAALDEKEFYSAACNFTQAGDYNHAMTALHQAIENKKNGGETWISFATLYKEIGDFDLWRTALYEYAKQCEEKEWYMSAIKAYQDLWDREKVKEMYKLQQEKVRNTLY